MSRQGRVYCEGNPAGVLYELPEGGYRFRYDDSYDGPPVSLTMPLRERQYDSRILFPFFDGLIPEGWLLAITTKNWKLSENDRMGLLLAVCAETIGTVTVRPLDSQEGEQGPGVLTPGILQGDAPAGRVKGAGNREREPGWKFCPACMEPLSSSDGMYHAACAKDLFGRPGMPGVPFRMQDLEELARRSVLARSTIPGVQKKLSVTVEPGRGRDSRLTITDLWGSHILKPPSQDYPELPANEHLTMTLARASGIETEAFGLVPLLDGELAFVAKRFDRSGSFRFACEDLAQLTGRLTSEKYTGSLEQAAKVIRQFCYYQGEDLLRFFEILVFAFLTGNADMHLKNFSLLDAPLLRRTTRGVQKRIRLSPAYDLLNTAIILEGDEEESALTLNGKKRRIKTADFLAFAETTGIPGRAARNALERIFSSVDRWEGLIHRSFLSDRLKKEYRQVVAQRKARLAG